MEKLLFIVDMQNDFLLPDGKLTVFKNNPSESSLFIDKVQPFLDTATPDMFDKIVTTFDTHYAENYSSTIESDEFVGHCFFGTEGWNSPLIFPTAIPTEKLYKHGFNIWNESNYKLLSADCKEKHIFLMGIATDYCVKYAMEGFLQKGAKVTVFSDMVHEISTPLNTLLADTKYTPYRDKGLLEDTTTMTFLKTFNPTLEKAKK